VQQSEVVEDDGAERQHQVCKVEQTPRKGSIKAAQEVVRDASQVQRIFRHFDADQSGVIEPKEFIPLLSKLMKQPKSVLDKEDVWKAWDEVDRDGSGTINFDEFQKWYCGTFKVDHVTDFRDFINDSMESKDQRWLRDVAAGLGIDLMEVEKIYKEFRTVDADDSGLIDYEEFKRLIQQQIVGGYEGSTKVPAKVVDKFWMDVDVDRDGSISFEEFAVWYVKFFWSGVSPMESYYQMLGTGSRHSMICSAAEVPPPP